MPKALPARLLLALSLLAGFWLRLQSALHDDGIVWPDEIYQSFEPAHRLVFGYGLTPWEFIEGARSWAVPGFVAFWLWVTKLLGVDRPQVYLPLVKGVFGALSVLAGLGVYRLTRVVARREGEDEAQGELAAAAAAALFVFAGPTLYFAARAMGENLAAVTVVWGLALVLDRKAPGRWLEVGGSLLGLAVLFRLQSALACAFALGLVALERDRPRLLRLGVTLGVWALIAGLFDAAVWHDAPGAKAFGLFHSTVVYLRFNVLEGGGARWGTSPPGFYVQYLVRSMPGVLALTVLGALLGGKRGAGLSLLALAFVGIHSALAHKEYRFLVPIFPVALAAAGVGFSSLPKALGRVAVVAAVVVGLASSLNAPTLTMGDFGQYLERPDSSAWNDFGDVNRLMLAANTHEDLCGLRIDVAHLAWTGGSTYLHRKAPLYMPGTPVQQRHFNYAITGPGSGGEVVAKEGRLELVRIPGLLQCEADPGYSWKLP